MDNIFFDLNELGYLGEGAIIGKTVRIRNPKNVFIGNGCIIDDFTYISANLKLGDYSHIGPNVTINGGGYNFETGKYVGIAAGCNINCTSNEFLSACLFLPSVPKESQIGGIGEDIKFGNHVTIGSNTIVSPGVFLPDGFAAGAHTIIRKRKYESWTLYSGERATRIMKRNNERIKKFL